MFGISIKVSQCLEADQERPASELLSPSTRWATVDWMDVLTFDKEEKEYLWQISSAELKTLLEDHEISIKVSGRFDAEQEQRAKEVLSRVTGSAIVDFTELDYIASAGLGALLEVHKRLSESGDRLKLVNMQPHIRELFGLTGFDRIFEIE